MNKEDGIVRKLYNKGLLNVEQEFVKDVHYEVITGSTSYAMNEPGSSDIDIVAITIPPIDYIFPYSIGGYIKGFGLQPLNFECAQQHHIKTDDGKEYDIAVYSIIKFFQLAAENNPNIVDVLFCKENLITHTDNIGKLIRQNRKLFLTKHSFHKFKSYAYSQLKKVETKNPAANRKELVEKFGYDTKFASHILRLCLECEMILEEHDLDLQRHSEILKSVRRGEWTLDRIKTWFIEKESHLNRLYVDSTLRYSPDWEELKRVLLCCLEERFGSVSKYLSIDSDSRLLRKFEQIKQIVNS